MIAGNPEGVKLFHSILNVPTNKKQQIIKKLKESTDPNDKKLLKYLTPLQKDSGVKGFHFSNILSAIMKSKKLRKRLRELTGKRFSVRKD